MTASENEFIPPPREVQLRQADLELARRALAGEPEAIEELGQRLLFVPRLLYVLNARRGARLSTQDLEDLGQNAIARIWEKLPTYGGTGNLEAWAQRFVRYEFMNEGRRRSWRRPDEHTDMDAFGKDSEGEAPEDELVVSLSRMDQDDVEILRLKHAEDLTLNQIAERFRTSVSTIKSRYYRSLAKLRERLPDHVRERFQ